MVYRPAWHAVRLRIIKQFFAFETKGLKNGFVLLQCVLIPKRFVETNAFVDANAFRMHFGSEAYSWQPGSHSRPAVWMGLRPCDHSGRREALNNIC